MINKQFPNSAGYVEAGMNKHDRKEVIDKFRNGELKIICSINILSIGFDCNKIDCIMLQTFTNSIARMYQQIGRGIRQSPDKQDCLIIDYSDNIGIHGKINDFVFRKTEDGWDLYNTKRKLTD